MSSTPNVNSLELTFRRAAAVWWAIAWRAVLLVGLAAGAVRFIFFLGQEVLRSMFGVPASSLGYLSLTSKAIETVLSLVVVIFAVELALRKRYREFTIRLVPRGPEKSNRDSTA